MKKVVKFILILCLPIIAIGQDYKPVQHFVYPLITMDTTAKSVPSHVDRGDKHKYIFNYAYTTCMDSEYNLPIWVSHHINSSLLETKEAKRSGNESYSRDPQFNTLKGNAYASSGYDHGHLAPAADFAWDQNVLTQSFLMTNMSPQHGCFNQKGWCHLEGTVRKWAEENPNADIYIVSGAVVNNFIDTLFYKSPKDFKVYVPESYYKVILITEANKAPIAIGYVMPNRDIPNQEIEKYAKTVREIEELTSLDFFTFLPREMQDIAETTLPVVTYYKGTVSCPDKNCDSIYPANGRKSPENRKVLRREDL